MTETSRTTTDRFTIRVRNDDVVLASPPPTPQHPTSTTPHHKHHHHHLLLPPLQHREQSSWKAADVAYEEEGDVITAHKRNKDDDEEGKKIQFLETEEQLRATPRVLSTTTNVTIDNSNDTLEMNRGPYYKDQISCRHRDNHPSSKR
jgi:hypothetical protein